MRWGLIPHWAKDEKMADKMINARVETLTQRPAVSQLAGGSSLLGAREWLL
jgi:putative SOS response-associated peptidase YedK